MRHIVAAILAAGVLSGVAVAGTVTVEYTEPSETVSGNPITDLKEVAVYLRQDGGDERKIVIPATSPSGGGTVVREIEINDPPVCGSTLVSVEASAFNIAGLEGVRAGPVTASRDNSQTPDCTKSKAPSNLTIRIEIE